MPTAKFGVCRCWSSPPTSRGQGLRSKCCGSVTKPRLSFSMPRRCVCTSGRSRCRSMPTPRCAFCSGLLLPGSTAPFKAWKILADAEAQTLLGGRIVLVGSGAAEVGGLRTTPVSAATPSVQVQADAVETLLSGAIPRRPPWVPRAEIWAAVFSRSGFDCVQRPVPRRRCHGDSPGALCLRCGSSALSALSTSSIC